MITSAQGAPVTVAALGADADDATLAAALAILDDGVGVGAYSLAALRAATGGEGLLLIARAEAVVIGVLIGEVLGGDHGWYDRFGAAARARVDAARCPGNLSGAAVAPAWRGRGVAAALTTAALRELRDRGCDLAVAVAWLHPGPVTSRPLLSRAGFTPIAVAADVYLADSLEHGLVCTYCAGPCRCAGELQVRPLTAEDPA